MTKIDPRIEDYMVQVETGSIKACEEQKLLVAHIRQTFASEDLTVDSDRLTRYIGLAKYFPWQTLFPWQIFVVGLHTCVFRSDGRPRWPDLFCELGRGAGKDGTIAWESLCLISPYNGIDGYDVDICANNEDQSMRPVKDVIDALETPENVKKLKRFFYWNRESVKGLKTRAMLRGRTNSPKGKDGLRSGICIFNEIHQYENYQNIDVFTTGLGKKPHPRRSYYTTNGDVREGPLDDLLTTSEEILRGGADDGGLLPFICKLDKVEEVHDEENWPKANPSLPYLPDLLAEIRKEYKEWKSHPERLPAFMTKRMNLPVQASDLAVTDYENIKSTNVEIAMDLIKKKPAVVGIDFSKLADMAALDLHVRIDSTRYDICSAWMCRASKDLSRIKAPLDHWSDMGLLTWVDDVEISPTLLTDLIQDYKQDYDIKGVAIDDFRFALMSDALAEIGFSPRAPLKNLKLVRPSDIMRVVPVIDSCFRQGQFIWGDNPLLRWATNNAKLVRFGRKAGKVDDADLGNYVYGKIEAKSRKTDPWMALVAAMTIEDFLPVKARKPTPVSRVYTY